MKALSLFSGIGGIDLACEWAGIKTVAFCEKEPFCQRVLRKHWIAVPIVDDVHELTRRRLDELGIGAIDLISAGYPCQPFSVAGKRRGAEDDRHLWPEVARILSEIRPRWFVGENVAGHVTLGLDDVLSDLESLGYTAQAFVIPACAVYASHRRDRVFIVAYATCELPYGCGVSRARRDEHSNGCENVAYTDNQRYQERNASASGERMGHYPGSSDSGRVRAETRPTKSGLGRGAHELSDWLDGHRMNPLDALSDFISTYPQPALMGQPQYDWEPPRVATGVKNRAERLRALGNAVDPLQIYPIMYAIKQINDWLRVRENDV